MTHIHSFEHILHHPVHVRVDHDFWFHLHRHAYFERDRTPIPSSAFALYRPSNSLWSLSQAIHFIQVIATSSVDDSWTPVVRSHHHLHSSNIPPSCKPLFVVVTSHCNFILHALLLYTHNSHSSSCLFSPHDNLSSILGRSLSLVLVRFFFLVFPFGCSMIKSIIWFSFIFFFWYHGWRCTMLKSKCIHAFYIMP